MTDNTIDRIALVVEYNGQGYHGWQSQSHAPSVQQSLEGALSRVADHDVAVTAAGRTDAGVHALAQVVHFDTSADRAMSAWTLGCNSHLPADISVSWAGKPGVQFHARYSASARHYRYFICDRRTRPALLHGRVAWYHYPLDACRMHEAGQLLLGEHDFTSFRAAECQSNTPYREILSLSVQRQGELVIIDVCANAFLHHMVRNIAGVMMAIGRGDYPPQWAGEVLAARCRSAGGVTAPASGLYFLGPVYDPHFGVPSPGSPNACLALP